MSRISVLNFVSGNNFEEYCTLIPGISTCSEDLVTRSSYSYIQWGLGKKKHAFLYCIVYMLCATVTILWYFSSVIVLLCCDGLVVARTYWKVVENCIGAPFWEFASGLKILTSSPAIQHPFIWTLLVFADFFTVNAHHHMQTGQEFNLTLTIEFWNLWTLCYRFTYACFHTVQSYVAYSYQQSLSRCIICQRAKMSAFSSHMWQNACYSNLTWIFEDFCLALLRNKDQQ